MFPVTIAPYETRNSDFHVTVVGVGEDGETAVGRYPFYSDRDRYGFFETLTFLGDQVLRNPEDCYLNSRQMANLRRKINGLIKRTNWLFLVADISNEDDAKSALHYAQLHKKTAATPFSVLVEVGNHFGENVDLEGQFDLIISVEDRKVAYKPIDILVSGMITGAFGLDFADVMSIVCDTPVMKFVQKSIPNMNEREQLVSDLKKQVAANTKADKPQNVILLFSAPGDIALENLDEVAESLYSITNGGDAIWQLNFLPDEDDEHFTTSLLYGVQNPKGESPKWKMFEFSDFE